MADCTQPRTTLGRTLSVLFFLALLGGLAWGIAQRLAEFQSSAATPDRATIAVPVEVATVNRGALTLRRTFSGSLEAAAEFVISPKVGGRVLRMEIDLGDRVQRGQLVALVEDDEYVQAVRQAEAELAVARANRAEAQSSLEINERALARAKTLREGGVSSEAQLDTAMSAKLAGQAQLEVTTAGVTRAQANLESARIRLGYTRVHANWSGEDQERVVSERFVDEGGTVAANGALFSIVQLDPIVAVIEIPERDYTELELGKPASLTTDSYPGRSFQGRVTRIAPVFRRATRQARVELSVENSEEALKPGMFVRATLELRRVENATTVPFDALTERSDQLGVFLLGPSGQHVQWRAVEAGVREGSRIEIWSVEPDGPELAGRVVILGQSLCDDGSQVTVAGESTPEADAPR